MELLDITGNRIEVGNIVCGVYYQRHIKLGKVLKFTKDMIIVEDLGRFYKKKSSRELLIVMDND